MNTIKWFNFSDTDADTFNVYRSIPGIVIPNSNSLHGSTLTFSATSPDVQNIVIDATSADSIVASFSSAKGILAKKSNDGTKIFLRLNAKVNARLKIYKCSCLDVLGLNPQIIVPNLNFEAVAIIPFVSGSDPYSYDDLDGSEFDTYSVSSVKGGIESLKSTLHTPQIPGVSICTLEGRFINIQGRPVSGIEVTAAASMLDTSGLSSNKVSCKSDAYGRVSLPLLQNQQYILHIPAIGYNQYISVPAVDFLDITSLNASTVPEFS